MGDLLQDSRGESNRKGVAAVEAALVLPFVFLLILGTTEICNRVFLNQALCTVAYEGARVAIVPESTIDDIEMQVNDAAEARGIENVSVSVSPADFTSQPVGTFIEVSVTASGRQPLGLNFFPSSDSTSSVFIMKENE